MPRNRQSTATPPKLPRAIRPRQLETRKPRRIIIGKQIKHPIAKRAHAISGPGRRADASLAVAAMAPKRRLASVSHRTDAREDPATGSFVRWRTAPVKAK